MKTDLFQQSCGHCWVFLICWHNKCSTFTASSFWIWNSSIGIPSPPLSLFVVMLSKVHWTSHSRMSGSRWVITPSWYSRSWRSFLCSSSVYFLLIPLFNIFCLLGLYHFCPLLCSSLHEMFPCYLSFFLKRSLVFPILLFSSVSSFDHWGRISDISPCCSLKLCIQMGRSFLFSFAFHFFSQLFVRSPQTTILPFCISFSWGWPWSLPSVQCCEPPTIVFRHSVYQI